MSGQTELKLMGNSSCRKVWTRLIWKSILIFHSWVFNLNPDKEDSSRYTNLALVITASVWSHKDPRTLSHNHLDSIVELQPVLHPFPNLSLTFLLKINEDGKWSVKQMRGCKTKSKLHSTVLEHFDGGILRIKCITICISLPQSLNSMTVND